VFTRPEKDFDRLQPLLDGAKANTVSLAVFKPTKIHDFIWEEDEREWDSKKLAEMRRQANHGELFSEDEWRQSFQLMPKLPYNFSYQFSDADGRKSELQVFDWEAGQLYWNCLRDAGNDEPTALKKVRQKYFDDLAIATAAVPYLFESYYLLLILPLLLVLFRDSRTFVLHRVRTSIHLAGIIVAGVAYSLYKLKQSG
jgi:hypothetical protein